MRLVSSFWWAASSAVDPQPVLWHMARFEVPYVFDAHGERLRNCFQEAGAALWCAPWVRCRFCDGAARSRARGGTRHHGLGWC